MQQMGNHIRHQGIVCEKQGSWIRVELMVSGKCTSCELAGSCETGSRDDKMVWIPTSNLSLQNGDTVWVELNEQKGLFAAFLGYILPFLLFILSLIAFHKVAGELLSGLIALSTVGFYYLLFYVFFRKSIKPGYSFSLSNPELS